MRQSNKMTTLGRILNRAEETQQPYKFEDPDDNVVEFPTSFDGLLAKDEELERLLVEFNGEYDRLLDDINRVIEHKNAVRCHLSEKLKNRGIINQPILIPKKVVDLPNGPPTPPSIPDTEVE